MVLLAKMVALLLLPLLLGGAASRAPLADIATIQPTVRSTVANSLWGNDAFPGAPPVRECDLRLPAACAPCLAAAARPSIHPRRQQR